jgi:hypothetical protein
MLFGMANEHDPLHVARPDPPGDPHARWIASLFMADFTAERHH